MKILDGLEFEYICYQREGESKREREREKKEISC